MIVGESFFSVHLLNPLYPPNRQPFCVPCTVLHPSPAIIPYTDNRSLFICLRMNCAPISTIHLIPPPSCITDYNECSRRPCQHRCMNTYGSYRCYCEQGYMLSNNARNCYREYEIYWMKKNVWNIDCILCCVISALINVKLQLIQNEFGIML